MIRRISHLCSEHLYLLSYQQAELFCDSFCLSNMVYALRGFGKISAEPRRTALPDSSASGRGLFWGLFIQQIITKLQLWQHTGLQPGRITLLKIPHFKFSCSIFEIHYQKKKRKKKNRKKKNPEKHKQNKSGDRMHTRKNKAGFEMAFPSFHVLLIPASRNLSHLSVSLSIYSLLSKELSTSRI